MKDLLIYKKALRAKKPNGIEVKAVGASCNLECKFCHYAEKAALFKGKTACSMAAETLTQVVKQTIESVEEGPVTFKWTGGEPLLAGVEFYERALALQEEFGVDREIFNEIRTNGTLIDEAWVDFFAQHNFTVWVELDGPEKFHDRYRLMSQGGGTFKRTIAGIEKLKGAGVEFSLVTHVHRSNQDYPHEVYRFLAGLEPKAIDFVPVVEREANQIARDLGLRLATPPPLRRNLKCQPRISSWSVTPPGYAHFMIEIFDRWVRKDIGRVEIPFFSDCLRRWKGEESGMCSFNETCGGDLLVEHDGSVYACEQFVYPDHKRGHIAKTSIQAVSEQPAQESFGCAKKKDLPAQCKQCQFLFACNGGCPKQRFSRTTDGDPGLNYLCGAYQRLYHHLDTPLKLMLRLEEKGRDLTEIKEVMMNQARVSSF